MTKLCQITALISSNKTLAERVKTDVYHRLQKPALFTGLRKRYTPNTEDGETFPDETQKVQFKVKGCLDEFRAAMVRLLDLIATQDTTNCAAKADVKIDGVVFLPQVPVSHLLFMEKHLTDLATGLSHIHTLDSTDTWTYDGNVGYYVTEENWTNKTKKVPRNHVLAEATKEHPAQVQMYNEDVVVGKWKTVKFSAAITADEKSAMLARLTKLQEAVKCAREEANITEVVDVHEGDKIFDFVFGGTK